MRNRLFCKASEQIKVLVFYATTSSNVNVKWTITHRCYSSNRVIAHVFRFHVILFYSDCRREVCQRFMGGNYKRNDGRKTQDLTVTLTLILYSVEETNLLYFMFIINSEELFWFCLRQMFLKTFFFLGNNFERFSSLAIMAHEIQPGNGRLSNRIPFWPFKNRIYA